MSKAKSGVCSEKIKKAFSVQVDSARQYELVMSFRNEFQMNRTNEVHKKKVNLFSLQTGSCIRAKCVFGVLEFENSNFSISSRSVYKQPIQMLNFKEPNSNAERSTSRTAK